MEQRQVLHTLIDQLPSEELNAAKRFLEYLRFRSRDPRRAHLEDIPLDDEPVTEEDLAAISEGFADRAKGETISHEEAERLLFGPK
jgi:predicted transcriptional regulator